MKGLIYKEYCYFTTNIKNILALIFLLEIMGFVMNNIIVASFIQIIVILANFNNNITEEEYTNWNKYLSITPISNGKRTIIKFSIPIIFILIILPLYTIINIQISNIFWNKVNLNLDFAIISISILIIIFGVHYFLIYKFGISKAKLILTFIIVIPCFVISLCLFINARINFVELDYTKLLATIYKLESGFKFSIIFLIISIIIYFFFAKSTIKTLNNKEYF